MKNQSNSKRLVFICVGTRNQCTTPNLSGNGKSGERISACEPIGSLPSCYLIVCHVGGDKLWTYTVRHSWMNWKSRTMRYAIVPCKSSLKSILNSRVRFGSVWLESHDFFLHCCDASVHSYQGTRWCFFTDVVIVVFTASFGVVFWGLESWGWRGSFW